MVNHRVVEAAYRARQEISRFLGATDGKAQVDWRRTFAIQIDAALSTEDAVAELSRIRETYL